MYLQCPHCRTINDYDNTSFGSDGDQIQCHHCQSFIKTPPVLGSIFPNTGYKAKTLAADENIRATPLFSAHLDQMDLHEINPLHSPHSQHAGWWTVAILGLLTVFVLQYGYFMRDELARHVVLRPLLERLCALASCEIPMRKDVSKIMIVNRDIRSALDSKNILRVNITLQNTAPHVQPYPQMQLSFSGLNGRRIASRRFNPDEYLSKQIDINEGMAPQIPVIANLEILDPGTQATTFEFEFF